MRIGLLGAGRMVGALGTRFARAGHRVRVGARNGEKAAALAERIGSGAKGATLREAAIFGEILLLAVRRTAIAEALRASGAEDGILAGKILIDCNNPGPDPEGARSIAEEIGSIAKGAYVVKAFICCHFDVWTLTPPIFDGRPLVVPICGDAADTKAIVGGLVAELGCHPLDLGPLGKSRHLEYLAAIVIGLLFSGYEPYTVFNLVTSTEF